MTSGKLFSILPSLNGLAPISPTARPFACGGSSDLYQYRDKYGNLYAVKINNKSLSDSIEVQRHFLTETNILSHFNHPNIIHLYHHGIVTSAKTNKSHGYIVFNYASQGNLKERVFDATRVLYIGIQLCDALDTVHRIGIIHRDIKPSNILMNAQGTPLLSDFGISSFIYKLNNSDGFSLPWAAPEILAGELEGYHGSKASDIYSLGATLCALLTGFSPFELEHNRTDPIDLSHLSRMDSSFWGPQVSHSSQSHSVGLHAHSSRARHSSSSSDLSRSSSSLDLSHINTPVKTSQPQSSSESSLSLSSLKSPSISHKDPSPSSISSLSHISSEEQLLRYRIIHASEPPRFGKWELLYPHLTRALQIAMAPEAQDRYKSAAAFGAELTKIAKTIPQIPQKNTSYH